MPTLSSSFRAVEVAPEQGLIDEINAMAALDQDMRAGALDHGKPWDGSIDQRNTARMKVIVEQIGWPKSSVVGREAAHNAWVLVQHADHDVEFQAYCLELMKACPSGEVEKVDIAYLEDRVKVNSGQPQVYGTQGRPMSGGDWDVLPIEERANVDQRRASVGIEPLGQYILFMNRRYGRESS